MLLLRRPDCTFQVRQQPCWWWTAPAKQVDLPDKGFSLKAVKGHNSVDQPHVEGLFSIVHPCQEPHLPGSFLTCTASLLMKHITKGSTDKGIRQTHQRQKAAPTEVKGSPNRGERQPQQRGKAVPIEGKGSPNKGDKRQPD